MTIESLIWLIPLPPLLAFFIIILFANRSKGLSHSLAIGSAFLAWIGSMLVFWQAVHAKDLGNAPFTSSVKWIPTGSTWLSVGVAIDPLSAITLFFVAWTVLAIFIYSTGYHNYGRPKGDADQPGLPPRGASTTGEDGHTVHVPSVEPMYSRFFAFISLFAFAMFALVVSDNLLTLYIAWEIMGLCSYLLIGFWYAKKSARDAAVKAFLTTRVGDVFMLLGLAYLYTVTGTLNFHAIFSNSQLLNQLASTNGFLGLSVAGQIGILLFIGTMGKSAQWPLHVWLPDAMEGPTPVSAMIHAATMVSAGVYLAIRIFPLVSAGWESGQSPTPAMTFMAFIGAFTALFAATIAVTQNDIKRVLAYSTISQLGYMIAALGIGAYAAAAFHLFTHAFFKALLFMGSGSVIHGMEHGAMHTGETIDVQDMTQMGGLRKKMPITFWTFLVGGLALSGFPLVTAGFWSKDAILSGAFNGGSWLVFLVLALAALLTAFYTMRQISLTFLGAPRSQSAEHASETSPVMTLPLVGLAVFALAAGWSGIPQTFPLIGGLLSNWFEDFVNGTLGGRAPVIQGTSLAPLLTSLVVSLGGLYLGWKVYQGYKTGDSDPLEKGLGGFYPLLKSKYYFDEFYHAVLVRPAYWLAEILTVQWMDKEFLDGILEGIGRGTLWFGSAFRKYFDVPVVNGAGDATGRVVRLFGFSLKPTQSGRVQQYMIVAIVVVIGAVLVATILLRF
jgi:NADH-quinone oxidoreductase subunit L